jgi:hypothetical protein
MSSCESCAARPSMRSVKNPPSRQRSSPKARNQWRDDFLASGQCGIQVRDSDQRDDFVQDFKSKRFRDQAWRSNNNASNCSRRKSASWKTACVFHSGGHRDERNDFTPRSGRASAFSTITSLHKSIVNVGTAQSQTDTPRPNANEPNA